MSEPPGFEEIFSTHRGRSLYAKKRTAIPAVIGRNCYICVRFNTFFADKMELISVTQYAGEHNLSERTVRSWCAAGKMEGAVLVGKTWNIPADCSTPSKTETDA